MEEIAPLCVVVGEAGKKWGKKGLRFVPQIHLLFLPFCERGRRSKKKNQSLAGIDRISDYKKSKRDGKCKISCISLGELGVPFTKETAGNME